eukprot:jgi/Ulvmu1/7646/UM038_0075.1
MASERNRDPVDLHLIHKVALGRCGDVHNGAEEPTNPPPRAADQRRAEVWLFIESTAVCSEAVASLTHSTSPAKRNQPAARPQCSTTTSEKKPTEHRDGVLRCCESVGGGEKDARSAVAPITMRKAGASAAHDSAKQDPQENPRPKKKSRKLPKATPSKTTMLNSDLLNLLADAPEIAMPENIHDEAVKHGWTIQRAQHIYSIMEHGAELSKNQGPRQVAKDVWKAEQLECYKSQQTVDDIEEMFALMIKVRGRSNMKGYRVPLVTKSCHQCQYQGVWHLCECDDPSCDHNKKLHQVPNKISAELCSQFVCDICLTEQYSTVAFTKKELQRICPACRGVCICRRHLRETTNRLPLQARDVSPQRSIKLSRLSVSLLLPSLQSCMQQWVNEAYRDGIDHLCDVKQTKLTQERCICSRCQTCISSIYRTCTDCSVDLCVRCCSELRRSSTASTAPLKCPSPYCDGGPMQIRRLLAAKHIKVIQEMCISVCAQQAAAWRVLDGVQHAFGQLATAPRGLTFTEEAQPDALHAPPPLVPPQPPGACFTAHGCRRAAEGLPATPQLALCVPSAVHTVKPTVEQRRCAVVKAEQRDSGAVVKPDPSASAMHAVERFTAAPTVLQRRYLLPTRPPHASATDAAPAMVPPPRNTAAIAKAAAGDPSVPAASGSVAARCKGEVEALPADHIGAQRDPGGSDVLASPSRYSSVAAPVRSRRSAPAQAMHTPDGSIVPQANHVSTRAVHAAGTVAALRSDAVLPQSSQQLHASVPGAGSAHGRGPPTLAEAKPDAAADLCSAHGARAHTAEPMARPRSSAPPAHAGVALTAAPKRSPSLASSGAEVLPPRDDGAAAGPGIAFRSELRSVLVRRDLQGRPVPMAAAQLGRRPQPGLTLRRAASAEPAHCNIHEAGIRFAGLNDLAGRPPAVFQRPAAASMAVPARTRGAAMTDTSSDAALSESDEDYQMQESDPTFVAVATTTMRTRASVVPGTGLQRRRWGTAARLRSRSSTRETSPDEVDFRHKSPDSSEYAFPAPPARRQAAATACPATPATPAAGTTAQPFGSPAQAGGRSSVALASPANRRAPASTGKNRAAPGKSPLKAQKAAAVGGSPARLRDVPRGVIPKSQWIPVALPGSRSPWAPTETEADHIRAKSVPQVFCKDRPGGLSMSQWGDRLRLAAWKLDNTTGENYILCVDGAELRSATDPDAGTGGGLTVPQAEDVVAAFWREWSAGKPVLVKNVRGNISWEPKCMRRATTELGNKKADTVKNEEPLNVQRCDAWTWLQMKPATFFHAYENEGKWAAPLSSKPEEEPPLLKLKDYPPAANFASVLPRHMQDFLGMLPVPHLTRTDTTVLNMATTLGASCVPTDLGPKCYIALGRPEERGAGDSVTRCHLDMSDAINIMLHAPQPPCGPPRTTQPWQPPHYQGAGAVWHVWRRQDLDALRRFMRANQRHFQDVTTASGHVELAEWEDPVHSQRFFLTDALLQKLLQDTGVQPWQFEQNLGEAVFIPAGCAHQVRNLMSSIKVAVDFVSPHNIGLCLHMAQEMRAHRDVATPLEDVYGDKQEFEHEDRLQAETILVYGAMHAYSQLT